jgi:hypothetical protein
MHYSEKPCKRCVAYRIERKEKKFSEKFLKKKSFALLPKDKRKDLKFIDDKSVICNR